MDKYTEAAQRADLMKRLLKDSVSQSPEVASNARQTFADLFSATYSRVLEPQMVANDIFGLNVTYTEDEIPEVPMHIFTNIGEGLIDIWSNAVDGGLQHNYISGSESYRFRPARLDTAISWNKTWAKYSRLDVVPTLMRRAYNEIAIKSQYNAFNVLAEALGTARTNGRAHVIPSFAKASGAGHRFQIEDVNNLVIWMERLNSSWANGSTMDGGTITDLYVSPEIMGDVRRMAYNPQNTTAVPDTNESTVLGLPDGVREGIFRAPNTTQLWDIRFHKMKELGVGAPYNLLFKKYYTTANATPTPPTWVDSTDEIIFGIDRNMNALAHAVLVGTQGEGIHVEEDDQFTKRSNTVGYYMWKEEAWLVGNSRAVVGMIV